MTDGKTIGIIGIIAKAAWTALVVSVAAFVLYKYEYFSEFTQIDNMIGMLPVSLALAFAICAGAAVWLVRFHRYRAVALTLAVISAVSAALFPTALVGGWWIGDGRRSFAEISPDLTLYAPFVGSETARLDFEAELKLEDDLPVLDGALALYPVYSAIVEAVYSKEAYEKRPESVMFTNTVKAFDAVIAGERDIIFSSAPSAKQLEAARAAGVELHLTPIGKEAFVFLVGKDNPVEGITTRQIHNIYTGKTAKWSTLGWKEGGDIVAFRRPEGSGSESGIQSVMRGYPLIKPQPLPDKSLAGEGSLMQQISVEYKGVQPALGYSYRYFANTMFPNEKAKMLAVDGVSPTAENIASGAYPFTVFFYAITRGEPTGNSKNSSIG